MIERGGERRAEISARLLYSTHSLRAKKKKPMATDDQALRITSSEGLALKSGHRSRAVDEFESSRIEMKIRLTQAHGL
jgi:hypothetical protein